MRFLVTVPANKQSEAGELPRPEEFEEMHRFNEGLVKSGIMLAAEGLQPTSKAVKLRYDGKDRTVTDGPFTETKELIAGFWLLEARSIQEIVEIMKRAPFDGGVEIVIRPVYESSDLEGAAPAEVLAAEERWRANKA